MTQTTSRIRVVADGGALWEQFDYDASGLTTTGTYQYLLKIDCTRVREGTIMSKNTHATNTIFFKIIGSNAPVMPAADTDPSWFDVVAETSLNNLSQRIDSYSTSYKWLWVGCKTNSGAGTFVAWHRGTN